jgi:hypothetical protein
LGVQQGVRVPGPLTGSWISFLTSGDQGLLVPNDDSQETNWSVFLTSESGWLPAQVSLDTVNGAVSRVAVNAKYCIMDQESDAVALTAWLHTLAARPGASAVDRDRFLEAVAAVASASGR